VCKRETFNFCLTISNASQAKIGANEEMKALKAFQSQLKGGRRK